MSAFEKIAGMFSSRELGEQVAHEVVQESREETLRLAADYLREKYGVTNRAAGDLLRLAELESQGRSALATPTIEK
ncbi:MULTISPECIES: hypothetical protein [unclassified Streptomyces]|uniref:hypothetical protein n=1 Tax=unclassified Streptomyces TaxID=2593676 RepID=UPI002FC72327